MKAKKMIENIQQRARTTKEVLNLVNPLKKEIGVTRLADITHLDNIGIPVYCSYRPKGYVLQANAGKGYTHEAAQCSAMMEALEYSEFEKFDENKAAKYSAYKDIKKLSAINYRDLTSEISPFYSDNLPINWIQIEDLKYREEKLCPADLVYLLKRQYTLFHTNGIASGNTNSEATLHALYEVIERDAYARILVDGKLNIREVGKSIDLDSIESNVINELTKKVREADNEIFLIKLPTAIDVYAFWCVVLDNFSVSSTGSFNIGLGCHSDPNVAAIRAITEAVQSRLIYIHGNREDIRHKAVFNKEYNIPKKIYSFFPSLIKHNFSHECRKESPYVKMSIEESVYEIVAELNRSGYEKIYRHILRDEKRIFSVVKVIIPGMKCENRLL